MIKKHSISKTGIFEHSFLSLSKLDIWLLQKTEFLGGLFQEENTIFLKMPKFSTFERILLSGNSVSFRLKKGKKFKELLIPDRVDYYCKKPIICVLTIFSTQSFQENKCFTLFYKMKYFTEKFFFKFHITNMQICRDIVLIRIAPSYKC